MRILICNERFLFRFGVDRVLLMLGTFWRQQGHEVIMMGNKLDPKAVDKCSDRFISVPEARDYYMGNEETLAYMKAHWNEWFRDDNLPDLALVAGWPFYKAIPFLKQVCGCAVFHDYGAVPTEGMDEGQIKVQNKLRALRKENLVFADRVIAISRFLEDTQSKPDVRGTVPTAVVHLGIDHINMRLWDREELNITQNDVLDDIRKYKKEGFKIIFQPGRWENGNYKNSAASIEVIRELKKRGIPHKVLVLSAFDAMGEIPEDVADSFYCLGFVDDSTMKQAMELSDAGMSPTLWEGFDLPLGEMQFLNRPMFVMNIGAHPEVAVDPYFLCDNIQELSEKLKNVLTKGVPIEESKLNTLYDNFRERFTWQNCADTMLLEFKQALDSSLTLFIDVTNASHDTANSGVMRVTRKLSRYLQDRTETIFLLWDDSINKYVLPYSEEISMLCSYGGPKESRILHRSVDGRPRTGLESILPTIKNRRKILLFTETVNAEIMQKVISYLQKDKIATAAVFHDAIPVLRPELVSQEVSQNHVKYMTELSDCDLVLATAEHNRLDLEEFWEKENIQKTKTVTVPLAAELDGTERCTEKLGSINEENIRILFVSTLEPRKNHIRFLKSFGLLMERYPELISRVSLCLIGNRYAGNTEIAEFVERFCEDHENVEWLGVVDDNRLKEEYQNCTFTVYPSEIEGFGMPIVESLWLGKPCLCSDSGSIGELAAAGGCCVTDVMDMEKLCGALYKMLTDKDYLLELQHQATECEITTWNKYADNILDSMQKLDFGTLNHQRRMMPAVLRYAIRTHIKEWEGRKVMIVSNFYPPNFIGGAEIIAHNQAKAMQQSGKAKVLSFSAEVTENSTLGALFLEKSDGIPVIRISVPSENFKYGGVNFFDPAVNNAFEEVCREFRPDVVHCHNIIGLSMGIVSIAKKYNAKVCFTLHDNWGFCFKNTILDNRGKVCQDFFGCEQCTPYLESKGIRIPVEFRRRYFRRVFEYVDGYISPSSYLASVYCRAGFSFHKMHVIWNGIDCRGYSAVGKRPSEKLRVTFVGYFGRHKGVDLLIIAVSLLNRKDVEINLVGSGMEESNYHILAEKYGVDTQIRFWGKVPNTDIGKVYAETDIYCLPSIWPENQPVSITEAMACGIPVIASSLGGNKELVRDGETGFLFNPGDAQDLAEKIRIFAENRELLHQFGAAGRDWIQKNDYSVQVERLFSLYDTMTSESGMCSKKMIVFKGRIVPLFVERVTSHDLLLWEWVMFRNDWKDVVAAVIMPGEELNREELVRVSENDITLFVQYSDAEKYRQENIRLKEYETEVELLAMISKL